MGNTIFYKYQQINSNSLSGLINNTIWLSSPLKFNDPYDCYYYYDIEKVSRYKFKKNIDNFLNLQVNNYLTSEEKLNIKNSDNPYNYYMLLLKKKMPTFDFEQNNNFILKLMKDNVKKQIDKVRNKYLVSSFNEDNESILMWSHYSCEHKGFCIEYDFRSEKNKPDKVHYFKDLIDLTKYIIDEKKDNDFRQILIYKNIDWAYEKEWRIVAINKDLNYDGHNMELKPKAVHMGTKISESNQKMLINICKSKNIPLYKMKMDSKEYKLTCDKTKDYTKDQAK